MNKQQRAELSELLEKNQVVDNTEMIRQLKHSGIIKQNVGNLLRLMQAFPDKGEPLHLAAKDQCSFLYTYYQELYQKIVAEELELSVLFRMLRSLEQIENGDMDQHDAAYSTGQYLLQHYAGHIIDGGNKGIMVPKDTSCERDDNNNDDSATTAVKTTSVTSYSWHDFKREKAQIANQAAEMNQPHISRQQRREAARQLQKAAAHK